MAHNPNAPKLVSSDQIFDGSYPMHTIYVFTPDQKHDPAHADNPIPRVMVTLDEFPVNPGMVTAWTRFEGADRTDQLPDHIAAAVGVLANKLVVHMRSHGEALDEERDRKLGQDHDEAGHKIKRVTRATSEGSVRGAHTIFVPVFEGKEPAKLWGRTYDESDPTRATEDELVRMEELLEVRGEAKKEMDLLLSSVYWRAVNEPTMTWWLGRYEGRVRRAFSAMRDRAKRLVYGSPVPSDS